MDKKLARSLFHMAMILASVVCLSALAGCSGHNDIVGKWRGTGDPSAMVWEFSGDGSVLMGSTRGRYSFGDRDRIKIQTPFGTSVYQVELAEDQMVLIDPGGSKLVFARVK